MGPIQIMEAKVNYLNSLDTVALIYLHLPGDYGHGDEGNVGKGRLPLLINNIYN